MFRTTLRTALIATLALPAVAAAQASSRQTAVFAGGCFWGIQNVFQHVKGVISATSGFSGGTTGGNQTDYETVSSGTTGHAESVKIVFDPGVVSYDTLLAVFFAVHDPTELNRQGPDEGTQYRSAIFYTTEEQHRAASAAIARMTRAHAYRQPIVTQVSQFNGFFAAESYHQDYAIKHPNDPYIVYNDLPKVVHLREQFPALYQATPAGH